MQISEGINIKNELGKKLLKLRKEKGLNQNDVAHAVGITRASLSYYEKGERSIDVEILFKLSIFYDVSMDYLFGLSGKTSPQRKHEYTLEMAYLGFSLCAIDEFWKNPDFVNMMNEFIAHDEFNTFKQLIYFNKDFNNKLYPKNYKSFLISQLIYSMITDISNKESMEYDDKIMTLPLNTKKELCKEIKEYLLEKEEFEKSINNNKSTNTEYQKQSKDIHDNLMRIYRKLIRLLNE